MNDRNKRGKTPIDQEGVETEELLQTLLSLEEKNNQLIRMLHETQAYKLRMERELVLAKSIQQNILPEPINTETIKTKAYYRPSHELSGDLYGYFKIDASRFAIFILDVMGHGLSSAFITMSLQSIIKSAVAQNPDPEYVLRELNQHFHSLIGRMEEEDLRPYCTINYSLIDTKAKEIKWISAGHPSGIWKEKEGAVRFLYPTSPPLGILEELSFELRCFSYQKGGALFLYTDGVSDVISQKILTDVVASYINDPCDTVTEPIRFLLETSEGLDLVQDDQSFIVIDINE